MNNDLEDDDAIIFTWIKAKNDVDHKICYGRSSMHSRNETSFRGTDRRAIIKIYFLLLLVISIPIWRKMQISDGIIITKKTSTC